MKGIQITGYQRVMNYLLQGISTIDPEMYINKNVQELLWVRQYGITEDIFLRNKNNEYKSTES